MASKSRESNRCFSIDRANASLPLVRVIVADLQRLSAEVHDRRERYEGLVSGRSLQASDPYAQELVEVERDLAREAGRLQEYASELRDLGVQLCDVRAGSVDFPGVLDGERVSLCWRLGESEVLYFHLPGESLAKRRPLVAGSLAEPLTGTERLFEG